jgi:hypothetical protein
MRNKSLNNRYLIISILSITHLLSGFIVMFIWVYAARFINDNFFVIILSFIAGLFIVFSLHRYFSIDIVNKYSLSKIEFLLVIKIPISILIISSFLLIRLDLYFLAFAGIHFPIYFIRFIEIEKLDNYMFRLDKARYIKDSYQSKLREIEDKEIAAWRESQFTYSKKQIQDSIIFIVKDKKNLLENNLLLKNEFQEVYTSTRYIMKDDEAIEINRIHQMMLYDDEYVKTKEEKQLISKYFSKITDDYLSLKIEFDKALKSNLV